MGRMLFGCARARLRSAQWCTHLTAALWVTESNNAIRIWRLSDGVLLKDIIVPNQYIGSVSLTPDGQYAAVSLNPAGGTAGNWSVALVRLSDSAVLATIDLSHFNTAGQFENFVLSPDATLLAVGTGSQQEGDSNGRVAIYSLPGGTLVNSFPPSGSSVPSCASCSFMPLAFQGDNQLVVEGYNTAGGNIVMYTAGTFSNGSSMTELVAWPTNVFMGTSPNNQTVMLAIDVTGLYAYPSSGCGSPPSPGCPAVAPLNQYFQSNDSGAFSQDSSLYAFWSNSPSNSTASLNLLSTRAWSSLASVTETGFAGPAAFSPNGTTVADSYESTISAARYWRRAARSIFRLRKR